MIFNCLRKSITDDVFAQVTTEPERYTFTVNRVKLVDGPCFLAAIIDHTYTNTLANTEAARENLASLAEYMEALPDSNVEKFKEQLHKANECKLKKEGSGKTKKSSGKFDKQKLKMRAYQSLFESSSEEEREQNNESSVGGNESEGSNTSE